MGETDVAFSTNHFFAVVFACERLERGFNNAAAETEHKVQSRFLIYPIAKVSIALSKMGFPSSARPSPSYLRHSNRICHFPHLLLPYSEPKPTLFPTSPKSKKPKETPRETAPSGYYNHSASFHPRVVSLRKSTAAGPAGSPLCPGSWP